MRKTYLYLLGAAICFNAFAEDNVTVNLKSNRTCTMSNGIITLSIQANGMAMTMKHPSNGPTNILASNGIYFDYTADKNRSLSAVSARVVRSDDDYAEVVYTSEANDVLPTYEHGYIMRKGESGIFTYVIVHGNSKSADTANGGIGPVRETRVCTRLAPTFLDGYVDEQMQGPIPSNTEMSKAEQNQVQDATYYLSDGSIYTKYNWAQFIDHDDFHGLMNSKIGVWNIPVSYEWLNGGPMRQELTVHATSKSPITIQMLQGEHLGAAATSYGDDQHQIFGPFMIYVNDGATREERIADARAKAAELKAEWPFAWFENEYYPLDRSTVSGKINITTGQEPGNVKVVLAAPGSNLLRQGGDYMFWTLTDEEGNFSIPAVRKGSYSLYAYATTGTITDELCVDGIEVGEAETNLGDIEWTPFTLENQLWNIGENNRLADGFNCSDRPRAYEAWQWQPASLEYRIGESDPGTDWYNAQTKNGKWTIKFNLDRQYEGDAVLTASIAGVSNSPKIQVAVNGKNKDSWSLSDDGSIRRSATLAGRHLVKSVTFPASDLQIGENEITLTASNCKDKSGVLWDCIKLEAGDVVTEAGVDGITEDASGPVSVYTMSGLLVGTFDGHPSGLPSGIYIFKQGSSTKKVRL
ncbi:MAG: hypothetical protein K2M83_02510 [Muribaculaceae bacterium]|nr:hypothetical protein [Muribaculaceae bacterium]